MTKASITFNPQGSEFVVAKFKLGTFMPNLPAMKYLDGETILPEAGSNSVWLGGSVWKLPDYHNIETFVDRLVHEGVLVWDQVVEASLQDQPVEMSVRTIRHRFMRSTGLTQGYIRQIERARQATVLLEQGKSILDTVDEAGYADQAHLTRSLKHFVGQTPAQIVRMNKLEMSNSE
jgi:AraC-like DNA-binding protein